MLECVIASLAVTDEYADTKVAVDGSKLLMLPRTPWRWRWIRHVPCSKLELYIRGQTTYASRMLLVLPLPHWGCCSMRKETNVCAIDFPLRHHHVRGHDVPCDLETR